LKKLIVVVILLLSLWPTSLDERAACKSDAERAEEYCKSEVEHLGTVESLELIIAQAGPARDVGRVVCCFAVDVHLH
jgi:hypothetical protein